jgi:hypothetical protein
MDGGEKHDDAEAASFRVSVLPCWAVGRARMREVMSCCELVKCSTIDLFEYISAGRTEGPSVTHRDGQLYERGHANPHCRLLLDAFCI